MTTVIVATAYPTYAQLDKIAYDLFEAIEFENETGFVTRVACTGWHNNGKPIYERIPDDEQTWIEGFMQQLSLLPPP